MTDDAEPSWEALVNARDEVAAQLGSNPAIRLVDIALVPSPEPDGPARTVVRIHVRSRTDAERLEREIVPRWQIGVPVVVVVGDYRLESGDHG